MLHTFPSNNMPSWQPHFPTLSLTSLIVTGGGFDCKCKSCKKGGIKHGFNPNNRKSVFF